MMMKQLMYIPIFALALQTGQSSAKEVKQGSKEYENAKLWEVGDDVEGWGIVVKKSVKGNTVTITFKQVGIEYLYQETQK